MRLAYGLFIAVAVVILGFWHWLGLPVEMPPSPLAAGEKLYCVSYAPFKGEQTPLDPLTRIDPAQIEEDLGRLTELTDCIRTYSADLGLDRVAEIAERHGLKVMQGLWIGRDRARNSREIAAVVDLAKRHPGVIRSIVVGNETLLRGEIGPNALADIVRQVKAQVGSIPVTYADVWEFWLRAREVYDAVDFVTIHILPYWEDFPIPANRAAAHVAAIRREVAAAYARKEVLVGEVGWPSAGRMREGALPSPANQARVIQEILTIAKREDFHVNVIEAFDQPWKERLEGTVGGHWGILEGTSRRLKFRWGEAVANHPDGPLQAGLGILLAGLTFAAALLQRGGKPDNGSAGQRWFGVAAIAGASGSVIGWAVANVGVESLGLGGWARSLAMTATAAAAPICCAAALVRRVHPPGFSNILGRRHERPRDPLIVGLGVTLVALTTVAVVVALGLVFDPRYRDFPFAPLTAATVPFLVLSFAAPRPEGPRGMAERVAAATLAGSAAYIVLNEGLENWQAVWLGVALAALALTLVRSRDGRS